MSAQRLNLREHSVGDYLPVGASPGREEITLGCLQRIADAMERIADAQWRMTPQGVEMAAQEKESRLRSNLQNHLAEALWSRIYQTAGHPGRCSGGVHKATRRWAGECVFEARARDGGPITAEAASALLEAARAVPLGQLAWEELAGPASARWLREKFPAPPECGTKD